MNRWLMKIALLVVVGGVLGWTFWSAVTTTVYAQSAGKMNLNLQKSTCEYDWGDAPDPTYPSLQVNNGAYHKYHTFWLGEQVSGENNSKQVDSDEFDDGIVFLGSGPNPGGPYNGIYYIPGEYGAVRVIVAGTSCCTVYIHGWIDWNGDGDWYDEGENIFSEGIPAAPRVIDIEFQVPLSMVPGDTWARFRVDHENLNSVTGVAEKGEVEDYHLIDWLVAVEMDIFEASCVDGRTVLHWRTRSETENLGFDIYRSETAQGEYQRINAQIVPAKGTSEHGEEYWYTDENVEAGRTYYYKLTDTDFAGQITYHGPVKVEVNVLPGAFDISQCYPNPFNPETEIEFTVKEGGVVRLAVYDVMGRFIRLLYDGPANAGTHRIRWDGTNASGAKLSSGTYIIRMTADNFDKTRKVTLAK